MLGFKIIRDAANDDWDLYWTDNAVTSQQLGKMKQYQKINHFPGMYTLSRKNYLARNLIKMAKKIPQDYSFFPKTWVLPSQLNQLKNFMQNEPNAVVIAKPEASSQGKGIFLTKNFQDFQYGEHYVVQKYLKKPFLIDGLKFDLRVYVLVAGCDPLRIYIYKQGLARFATDLYSAPRKQNIKNLYMHLTNYAINKNSEKFQFNQSATQMNKGHKRSLTSVLNKIEELGFDKNEVWKKIKDCIAKTVISGQPLLAHHYKSSQPNNYANNMCFQILGFDVILDHTLKPQILQVNYTPSFTTDTPLDLQIKKKLIHDALILMNLTNRAKNEIVNMKKKEMKERTLTGKNFYQTREARQQQTNKIQRFRNGWENDHLGNYQRIMPVVLDLPSRKQIKSMLEKNKDIFLQSDQSQTKQNQNKQSAITQQILELQQKYKQFLSFSMECYEANTGANIKRNQKVVHHTQSANQRLSILCEENITINSQEKSGMIKNERQNIYNQPVNKYTNTQNLQKIYKTKFRPMIHKKSKKQKAHENQNTELKSQQKQQYPEIKQKHESPYASEFHPITYTKVEGGPQKRASSKTVSKNLLTIKEQSKNGNHQRAKTLMKKGLSTAYNITFSDKKK